MRRAALGLLSTLLLLGGLGAAGRLAFGAVDGPAAPAAGAHSASAVVDLPPLPAGSHARVVQPVAGDGSNAADANATVDLGAADPKPSHAATRTSRSAAKAARSSGATNAAGATSNAGTAAINQATALGNGVALPPLDAPQAVRQIIAAGNSIARTPYIWGGGHGKWLDKGYDCSGSVSYVLAAAGLLDTPLASGPLSHWGESGPGRWVTIYANAGHVFLEVAGIRFDTGAQRVTGSRWAPDGRSTAGFTPRHPAGL